MGDRGQIHIEDSDVYLYTHWGATDLPELLREALAREERWRDYEYLTRIIFDTMVGDSQGSATGHGIGANRHGDVWRVIHVNCEEQTVTLEASDIGGDNATTEEYSFEEYIDLEPTISYPER